MNNNNNFVCPVCGLQNSSEYKYCKNCGTPLDGSCAPNDGDTQYTPPPNFGGFHAAAPNTPYGFYSRPTADYSAVEPELEGVDTRKVQAFVGGTKQDYFMQLFISMKRLGRKIFLNWPVALLGSLRGLGLLTSSAWFFYRKMYKIGIIVCLCSLLITCFTTLANYSETKAIANNYAEQLSKLEPDENGVYTITNHPTYSATYSTVNSISLVLKYSCVIFFALFANYYYYKHSTSRIKKLDRRHGVEKDYYYYNYNGRPNKVAAVLFVLGFLFLEGIISMIPYLHLLKTNIGPQQFADIIELVEGVSI